MILEESSNQMLLSEDLLFLSEQIIQTIDLVEDISDPQIISVSNSSRKSNFFH